MTRTTRTLDWTDMPNVAPREDRRVRRTREALFSAFDRLLATTPYSKITVSALAREAGVNRKTFYLHYSSVDDLLRDRVRKSVDRAVRMVGRQAERRGAFDDVRALTEATFVELQRNTLLQSNVAKCLPIETILDMIKHPLAEYIIEARRLRGRPDIPNTDYLITFYLGALFSVYEEWATKPDPKESVEEMAALVSDCVTNGLGVETL